MTPGLPLCWVSDPLAIGMRVRIDPSSEENSAVTIDDICDHVIGMHSRHHWEQRSSAERMLYLASEVGELARALIASERLPNVSTSATYSEVSEEMVDVIWNVCALAVALNIDLNSAIRSKLDVLNKREWDAS